MYVGDCEDGSGIQHMLWELVANSLDEHVAGSCDRIEVVLHDDGSASVIDGGRGFPVGGDVEGRSFLERCLTQFHITPTRDGHVPHVHVSLLGVGIAVVSALSESLTVTTERDRRRWRIECARGEIVAPLQEIAARGRSGTTVRFKPDASIFRVSEFDYAAICRRFHEIAALGNALRFVAREERTGSEELIEHPEGLEALLAPPSGESGSILRLGTTVPGGKLDAVLRWVGRGESVIQSYAQMRATSEGGSHVSGFLRGLVQGAHWIDKRAGGRAATRRAVFDGMEAVLHVTLFDHPNYGGPTKERIEDRELEAAIYHAVKTRARGVFEENRKLLARVLAPARPA
jgi:DNA gyrase subunit B